MPYKNKEDKKQRDKQYYIENREKILEYKKQYRKDNPEYVKQFKQYIIEYRKKNYEKLKKQRRHYKKNKRKANFKFNLTDRMGRAMRKALKYNKAGHHWEDLVGYSLKDLIKRLKKTIPKDYTWQDFIESKLQIDHIIPKSAFNYTKPEHIDFKRCWALKNLQLLPARDNLSKGAKLIKPFQPALKIKGGKS